MNTSYLHKMVASAKRKSRRGLTLIEAAMVLTILALVIGGVMLYYSSASNERQTEAAASQLGMIQQAVRSAYASQSSYTGLDTGSIATFLPNSMVDASGMHNAFNGVATVTVNANSAYFDVEFDTVPITSCQKLATMDFGKSTISLTVNGTAMAQIPGTPAEASADCTAGSTLVWTFQ